MKKILFLLACVCTSLAALAASISSVQARKAVGTWVRSRPAAHMTAKFGAAVGEAETVEEGGTNLFHVVGLDGGGFVVTSTDDRIQPIIAFSDSGFVEQDERNPLWVMLRRDLAGRMGEVNGPVAVQANAGGTATFRANAQAAAANEWAELLSDEPDDQTAAFSAAAGRDSITDVRVAQLVQSKWNQSTVGSGNCYNYYTPYDADFGRLVCGCVATAGAQLMRYWCYPTSSVSARTYTCAVFDKEDSYTMTGGTYDWPNMDLDPPDDVSDEHRKAIGKLCYDVGIACQMGWGGYDRYGRKVNSSGAGPHTLARALTEAFGYSNAKTFSTSGSASITSDQMKKVLFTNFDAGCPVLLGIQGNGGHEIVADGYGMYAGNYYTHLNLGWGGSSDAWYNLPEIGTGYNFSIVNCVVYNVFTDKTGELLTGRVLDASGRPLQGCTVSTTGASDMTDAQGIYALNVPGGSTYEVTASAAGYETAKKTVSVPRAVSDRVASYGPGYSSWYLNTATAGNSWGNDFALAAEAHAAELRVTCCRLSNESTTQSAVTPRTSFQRGETVYAYLQVQNVGDAATKGTVFVKHELLSGSVSKGSTIAVLASSLAAGATAELTASDLPLLQNLSVGTYTYRATVNGEASGEVTFAVTEVESKLDSVVVSGASSVDSGLSARYTCRALLENGTEVTAGPVWTLDGDGNMYASIDQDGVLRAKYTTVSRPVVVRATCIYKNVSRSGTKVVSILPALSLNEALDNATLDFPTYSASPWFGAKGESHDGADAAQSAAIGANGSTWFETTVDGAGTLSFWFRVSSEAGYDKLVVKADGDTVLTESGETAWRQKTLEFASAGPHTVRWTYSKDGSVSRGSDAAWVDEVKWTPDPTPVSLTISCEPEVAAGGSIQLAAIATMSAGDPKDVTDEAEWSVTSGSSYASVSEGGLLSALPSVEDRQVTVRAEYTDGTIVKAAEKTVRIRGVLPSPGKPVITRAGAGDVNAAVLAWSAADYATSYRVLRSTDGATEIEVANGLTTCSCRDAFALPGVAYTYKVEAVNASGCAVSDGAEAHRLVQVSVDVLSLAFAARSSQPQVLTFKANADLIFSFVGDESWLHFDLNDKTLTVWVDDNDGKVVRKASLIVTAGAETDYPQSVTIEVSQEVDSGAAALPDLAFAQSEADCPLYTAPNEAGPAQRLMDVGTSFCVRYGWVNQGAGTVSGSITNVVSIRTPAGEELSVVRQGFPELTMGPQDGRTEKVSDGKWTSLPAGVYCVNAFLDYENVIEETDKDNNSAQFRFALRDGITLNEALDCETSVMTFSSADDQWYGTRGLGRDGIDCAMTKLLGDGGTNTLTATLTGAGTLSFAYRVSTEAGYDVFRFLADGVVRVQDSGEGEWKTVAVDVEAGDHELQWIYGKDAKGAVGDDCVYLDQVVWTPRRSGVPPSNFSATEGTMKYHVKLTWTEDKTALRYVIERKLRDHDDEWALVYDGVWKEGVNDGSILTRENYLYRIKSVFADGESEWSDAYVVGWKSDAFGVINARYVPGVAGEDAVVVPFSGIWSARVKEDCDWIAIDNPVGTNEVKMVFRFAANPDSSKRTTQIVFTGAPGSGQEVTKPVSVTQQAPVTYGKIISVAEATGCDLAFLQDPDYPWFGQTAVSCPGDAKLGAARSAELCCGCTSRLEIAFARAGTLSFCWGTCSSPNDKLYCYLGDQSLGSICGYGGSTGEANTNVLNWTQKVVEIPSGGGVVSLVFVKGTTQSVGLNAGFVDSIVWTPATEDIVPPESWFADYPDLLNRLGLAAGEYEKAAKMQSPGSGSGGKKAADGSDWLVWMDYVCGTNPLESDSKFQATITMEDGVPKVEWTPKLKPEEERLRNYLIYGKQDLKAEDWTPVADGHEAEYKFFKVSVEMQ